MDALTLSRIQFALTIMFHYLFPPLTIGLGAVLVYLEWNWLRKGDPLYHVAGKFWTRIFGLNFALGVATGIVMEFQFGTNWAVYSRYVGDVFGSALAAEGIFAFFLESGFLAVLLFGWDKVSPRFHFFSTCMVALGSIFSSIWIVVANSWQQTPAGSHLVTREINGQMFTRAEIVDFWGMVLNPSTVQRLIHVWIGAFILGAFFVMSISAWYALRSRHLEFARRSFHGALLLGTIASLAQLVSGHSNADMIAREQPAKLAAFEGHFETGDGGAPLYFFGWPDEEARTVKHGVAIPGMLSFLIHWDFSRPVAGLDELDADYGEPPVWLSFQSYHLMVACGMLFIVSTLYASWCRWRGTLFQNVGVKADDQPSRDPERDQGGSVKGAVYAVEAGPLPYGRGSDKTLHTRSQKRWLLWFFVVAVVPAFAANELGWVAAEVGRQPWIVYPALTDAGQLVGGLRTSEAVSEFLRPEQVLGSIIMFGAIYLVLFALWIYVLNEKIRHGPDEGEHRGAPRGTGLLDAATAVTGHRESLTGEG